MEVADNSFKLLVVISAPESADIWQHHLAFKKPTCPCWSTSRICSKVSINVATSKPGAREMNALAFTVTMVTGVEERKRCTDVNGNRLRHDKYNPLTNILKAEGSNDER